MELMAVIGTVYVIYWIGIWTTKAWERYQDWKEDRE